MCISTGCIFTFLCFSAIVIIKCVYAFSHSIRISYMLYSKWRTHPTMRCSVMLSLSLNTLVLSTGGENFLFPVSWLLSNCNLHTHDSCSVKHFVFVSSYSTVHLCHLIFYTWVQSVKLKCMRHLSMVNEWMNECHYCRGDFIVTWHFESTKTSRFICSLCIQIVSSSGVSWSFYFFNKWLLTTSARGLKQS